MSDFTDPETAEDEAKKEVVQSSDDPAKLIHKIVSILYILIIVLNIPTILFTLIMGPALALIALWSLLCIPLSKGLFDNNKTALGYLILLSPFIMILFVL